MKFYNCHVWGKVAGKMECLWVRGTCKKDFTEGFTRFFGQPDNVKELRFQDKFYLFTI